MDKLLWWGYLHTNGSIQAKRYFSELEIAEAIESPFVAYIKQPFEATNREDALWILNNHFNF